VCTLHEHSRAGIAENSSTESPIPAICDVTAQGAIHNC
jgi:hypothetical protein